MSTERFLAERATKTGNGNVFTSTSMPIRPRSA
jgi:hypothetical protein